jgi:anti-sigma factor RsiW
MAIEPTLIAALECSDVERSVDPYLDREFDERERAEMDVHLAACPRCRSMVERQARVRAAVRAKLREALGTDSPAGRAPPALRARIEESLARRRLPLWRRALSPVPLATLAACVAGVLLVLWLDPLGHGDSPLVEDAIRKHHRELPLEVTFTDPESGIPGWFAGKLDFNPAPPRFRTAGVQVLGARLSHIGAWPAAYIRYQLPRGQAGLFIVDDPDGRFDTSGREVKIGPHKVRIATARGYNVAVWRQDEIVYSLVSDLDEGQLFELVQTAQAAAAR